MQQRFFLLLALIVPWAFASCFGPPADEEIYPYGPPRYGHGGSENPQPPAEGQNQNQQGNYEWGNASQTNPNAASDPNDPLAPPTGDVPPPPTGGAAGTNTGAAGGNTAAAANTSGETPYGIPVPGKDGMLYSPFSPDAGFIDITTPNADGTTSTLPPGTKIKDPFSGKAILVP